VNEETRIMTIVMLDALPIVAGALGLLIGSAAALVIGIVWRRSDVLPPIVPLRARPEQEKRQEPVLGEAA
jgi:hypothetical protein